VSPKVVYVATALCLVTFGAGYVLASTAVTHTVQSANGNYVVENPISWWTLPTGNPTAISVVPSTLPTSLNTTAALPTRLGSVAQGYLVNTGVSGDIAQSFKFTETTAAPAGAELELSFVVSLGSGTINATVYLETQTSPPGSPLTFVLYLDVGSAASSTVTINYAIEIAQLCSSVGSCP
jgi:hypothetical protein